MKNFLEEFRHLSLAQKVIFFGLIAGFLYFFAAHNHSSQAAFVDCTNYPTGKIVTVTMNDRVFTPRIVQAHVCDTLVITNNGMQYHQPALGTHPHHVELPGYESATLLKTGETFSVTLRHIGTLTFHDHVNPNIKGQLIILPVGK